MAKKNKIRGLNDRISEVIKDSPLTQLEIANKMKIDQAQISRWKKGDSEPTAFMLTQFVKFSKTKKSISWLLGCQEERGEKVEKEALINNPTLEELELMKDELLDAQRRIIQLQDEIISMPSTKKTSGTKALAKKIG